jgi:serine protease DegQ
MTFVIGALRLTIGSFEPPDAGQSVTPSLAPMLSRVNPTVVSISVRGKSNDEQDDTLVGRT